MLLFFPGIFMPFSVFIHCFFFRDFERFSVCVSMLFFQGFWHLSLSVYRCFFPVILKPFSIFVSMLFFPRNFEPFSICVLMLYFQGFRSPSLCINAFFQGFWCPSLSVYQCFFPRDFDALLYLCINAFFFQGFRCPSLSLYRCFWLPPDGYLWEINKRSCLPFICCDSSWNADHFIHCSFTKLEVKTLYFVFYRILT